MARFDTQPTTPAEAASHLDSWCPGWAKNIDKHTLKMVDGNHCVLGQLINAGRLYGPDFHDELKKMYGISGYGERAAITFANQDEEWKFQIDKRLSPLNGIKAAKTAKAANKPVFVSNGVIDVSKETLVVVKYKGKTLKFTERDAKDLAEHLLKVCR